MNLEKFRKELEIALMITNWAPSTAELQEIAKRIKAFRGEPTKSNIEKIVHEVVDSYEAMIMDGVDNSDLSTLLLLATKSVSNDD